jgi:hypothetical protein
MWPICLAAFGCMARAAEDRELGIAHESAIGERFLAEHEYGSSRCHDRFRVLAISAQPGVGDGTPPELIA